MHIKDLDVENRRSWQGALDMIFTLWICRLIAVCWEAEISCPLWNSAWTPLQS